MSPEVKQELPLALQSQHDFETLFRSRYSLLCAYANGFLGDVDASEEVVQDVMVNLWTRRATLTIETSLNSYLFRAVRNGCMNVIKHRKVVDAYADAGERMAKASPEADEAMIAGELQQKVREAIDRLPAGRKKIFLLSRYEGMTYGQIAEHLDISVKTVENQMSHALATLREDLSDYLPLLMVLASGLLYNLN